MKRTCVIVLIFALTMLAGYTARQEADSLPVFGRRQAVTEAAPLAELVPLGMTIGVRINTDGVMVLGTGSFTGVSGDTYSPADLVLLAGDLIVKIDGEAVQDKEDLAQRVADAEAALTFTIRRDGVEKTVLIVPVVAASDGIRRIGAWVRDSTKGIGTLTFFDPDDQSFGALGHGIIDVDTRVLMSVRNGVIMPSEIIEVKRGTRGAPGELEGVVQSNVIMGTVTNNTPNGIFGRIDDAATALLPAEALPAVHRSQIERGAATILTNAVDNIVQEFDIKIENINRVVTDETKSMVIRITDPALLAVTGGIVQGMSGSPIIQNGNIVGAITHVFVQDPTKGYAIFIEYML